MSSYIDKSLGDRETLLYRARFPWWYHLVSWLWFLILGIVVVGLVVFIVREIRAWTTEMGVTSQRLILKQGWIGISTEELALWTIEEVNLVQSFWGRICGFGILRVAGTGEGAITFPPAQNPLAFRAAVEKARSSVKEKGGTRMRR